MRNLKTTLVVLMLFGFNNLLHAAQFYIANGDIAALKAAINTSNTNNSPDTIHLAAYSVYDFSMVDNSFVHGDNALPVFKKDGNDINALTILGNGATFIKNNSIINLRLIYLLDCKIAIYDLNLLRGQAENMTEPGGAILINSARVSLYNCLLKDNVAKEGGAIYLGLQSSLTANSCTFTNNTANFGVGGAISNYGGFITMKNSVVVNNKCLNINVPSAIFNYAPLLSSGSSNNIYLQNTIVARNTYNNITSPDNGKEFDIAGAVYTLGNNFIGSYPVVTANTNPTTFAQGSPTAMNDYVGTVASPIDPQLGTLDKNALFTDSYALHSGSLALGNHAGTNPQNAKYPMIASNGINPAALYRGDVITITGANLSQISKVQFQGTPTITTGITTTDTTVTITVPNAANSGVILIADPAFHIAISLQSLKIKTVTTPVTPSNFTGVAVSTSSIRLDWQDVADEDNYQIEYKTSSDNNYTILSTPAQNSHSYAAVGLLCSKTYNFRITALGHGTQSSYSTVATVVPLQLVIPVISAPKTEGCNGTAITLTAPAAFGYLWSNGETTQSIPANMANDFSVQTKDNAGCVSAPSANVRLTFYAYPDTASSVSGNIIQSLAPGADHYQWYRDNTPIAGETAQQISASTAGTYKVDATKHGCTSTSRNIQIGSTGPTNFTSSLKTVCGGATGVAYSVPVGNADSYEWHYSGSGFTIPNSSTSNSILANFDDNASSGTLSVQSIKNGVKSAPLSLNVEVRHTPSPPSTITGDLKPDPGTSVEYNVIAIANVGYEWNYDGTGTKFTQVNNRIKVDFALNATSGRLSVVSTNTCGSSEASRVDVDVRKLEITAIEPDFSPIVVYPNPSDGEFMLLIPGKKEMRIITITDTNGKMVYQTKASDGTLIKLGNISKGIFFLTVENGEKPWVSKIVVR